ncbi:hypothetical protein [Sporosarcina cyprini]|uniref:hypothetical protein n=1 Tax=Sporosarcina cyprini TaxID=2910523 RepID=UPI001EE06181|nr:hypothetical protein [Sporosarcina cyprini]MCG3089865.1 hypothetical protein [Sporosarcina cyprini]
MKKIIILTILICGIVLLVPFTNKPALLSVFKLTEEPEHIIVRGSSGSALTVNISFGDVDVENWIANLKAPYPLLFLDMDWVDRFPETVELIKEKNIPVALLGHPGEAYHQNTELLIGQLERFEKVFGAQPLWFRTADEDFPYPLRTALWEAEVNALGSSAIYTGGEVPPVIEGEILSVPLHRDVRVSFGDLKNLMDSREFHPLEDVLFAMSVKLKKIPK